MAAYTDKERALVAAHFDADFYWDRNPDLVALVADPLQHFLASGWKERRDPNADFSVATYLDLHPDVAALGTNPFIHWLSVGKAEGRATDFDLGFRHAILHKAISLEARLELGREPPGAPEPQARLAQALEALGGERLFLSFSHDDYVGRVGGVQACLRREAQALQAAGWSHLHLYPQAPLFVTDFETPDPLIALLVDGRHAGAWTASQIAGELAAHRQRWPSQQVAFAIHSLLGHGVAAVTGILQAVEARSGFYWLHDQTSLCASYALLRNDVEYCGAPPLDSAACGICIYGPRRQVQVAEHAALFRAFDLTALAPSQAMLDHWRAKVPYQHGPAQVRPHAVLKPAGPAPAEPDRPLRIAFLGFAYPHKGWPIFRKLAKDFSGQGYEFLHLGQSPDPGARVRHVPVAPSPGCEDAMLQAVRREGVDVAMILSICPETFSFTAHEAVAGGAAVVAFADSCAVAQLVRDMDAGMLVADEAGLRRLFETRAIETLARRVRAPMLYDLQQGGLTAELLGCA